MSSREYDEEGRRRRRRMPSHSRPEVPATTAFVEEYERRLTDGEGVDVDGAHYYSSSSSSPRRRVGQDGYGGGGSSRRTGHRHRSGGESGGSSSRSYYSSSSGVHQAQRTSNSGRRHSGDRREKDRVATTSSSRRKGTTSGSSSSRNPRPVTSREEVIKQAMEERGTSSQWLTSDASIPPMSSHSRSGNSDSGSKRSSRSTKGRRATTRAKVPSGEGLLSIQGGRTPRAHQSDNRIGSRTRNLERGETMDSVRTVMLRELSGLNEPMDVNSGELSGTGGKNATRESLRLFPLAVIEESAEGGDGGNYQYRGEKRSRRRLVDNNGSTSASASTSAASASGDESSSSAPPAAEQVVNSLLWFKFHAPRCVFDDIMETCNMYEEDMASGDEQTFDVSRRGSILSIGSGAPFGRRFSMEEVSRRGTDGMLSSGHSVISAKPTSRKGSLDMLSVGSRPNRRSSMAEGSVASTGVDRLEALGALMGGKGKRNSSMNMLSEATDDFGATLTLPYSTRRESALLFVDISGFTKLSTMLDVEELSKAINSYFELIVHQISAHGGDVLKFAGDALFAEWSAVSEELDLAECTKAAAMCGASIVKRASGFKVYGSKGKGSKNKQVSAGSNIRVRVATLDVHCGLGVGPLTGLHVGNVGATIGGPLQVENRREYLFLGSPIDQVAKAEEIAQKGELVASPEAIEILSHTCSLPDSLLSSENPAVIALRSEFYVQPKSPCLSLTFVTRDHEEGDDLEVLRERCKELSTPVLDHARDQLGLYVHPVVRGDLRALTSKRLSVEGHRAEAELRNVYVLFISPKISAQVTGNPIEDARLFSELSDIMMVTMRALDRHQGQLRQFIVDDKGVVLIATWGLRGSTFPNMIGDYSLPATMAVYDDLLSELGVRSSIGATFGKVYCGVVGGVKRHEFAVLGPSVNLAARLMASKENSGILVDAEVREQGKNAFAFKSCGSIQAKGYADPVPTFQPLQAIQRKSITSVGVVGRKKEEKVFVDLTRNILESSPTKANMVVLRGEAGVGKTSILNHAADKIRSFCGLYQQHVCICRTSCKMDEELVPFSAFRDIFLYAIREYCIFDGTLSVTNQLESLDGLKNTAGNSLDDSNTPITRLNSGDHVEASARPRRRSSLNHGATDGDGNAAFIEIPYLEKMRWVCKDLGYEEEYADIVGSRLLDIEGANYNTTTVNGEVPTLDTVVDFLARAFMCFTRHAGVVLVTADDIQWIDTLSWSVLEELFEQGEDLLLLCSARDSERSSKLRISEAKQWGGEDGKFRFRQIHVAPLEINDMKYLIARVLGQVESAIDDEFCEQLHERSGGGVPVFCIELLDHIRRNMLYEIDEKGTVRLHLDKHGEQSKYGSGSILDEIFLQRFDSLDVHVRKVLQCCAILGMEFRLADVKKVNPEYLNGDTLERSIEAAIADRILVNSFTEDDSTVADSSSRFSGSGAHNSADFSASTGSHQSSSGGGHHFFRFATTMWHETVMRTMLSDRRVELHRNIALSMEAEGMSEMTDTKTLLKRFEHWKACTEFGKVAPLALAIGARLEEFESSQQSLDLYCDVLKMWRTDTKVNASLETLGAWFEPSLSTKALEYTVKLKTRMGKCLCDMGEMEKGALGYRDAYLLMTRLPASHTVSRTLLFPIISGLWQSIPWDRVLSDEKKCDFKLEKELVQRFIKESKENGNASDICRALAMQASLFARMSNFDSALAAQKDLELVYVISKHSPMLVNQYGSDFAAISYGNSVQWYEMIGDKASALEQIEFVVTKIIPKFPPIAVHDIFSSLFPIIMVMKDHGFGREAKELLKKYVLERFTLLGLSSSTYWYPLYKPLKILLELVILDDSCIPRDETQDMALNEIEKWVLQAGRLSPISALERYGRVIRGEICWRLARQKSRGHPSQIRLIEKGTKNSLDAMKTMKRDGQYAYMMKTAYVIYRDLQEMQKDLDEMREFQEYQGGTPKSDEKKKGVRLRRASD